MEKRNLTIVLMLLFSMILLGCAKKDKTLIDYESTFRQNMSGIASVSTTVSITDNDRLVYKQTKDIYVTSKNLVDCSGDIMTSTTELSDSFDLVESVDSTSFAAVSVSSLFGVNLSKLSNYTIEEDAITASINGKNYEEVFDVDASIDGSADVTFTIKNERLHSLDASYKTTTNKIVNVHVLYRYTKPGETIKLTLTCKLEGGKCKNSSSDVLFTYNVANAKTYDPNDEDMFGSGNIINPGYRIEGWYLTKTVENGNVVYSDRWDFDMMRITEDTTIYAKWVKITTNAYEIFYTNSSSELVSAGKYIVSEGQVFADSFNYAKKISGYTSLGNFYKDKECTIPWDTEFKHPGGEKDLTIPVYMKVIEGEYAIVSTAEELKNAAAANKNIYLVSDIDFDKEIGEKEKKKTLTFENYSGIFEGNGHTVSNFNIVPQKSTGKAQLNNDSALPNLKDSELENAAYYAIFKSLDGATVSNVTFLNVRMSFFASTPDKISTIFVSNLAVTAKDSKITNVKVVATYEIDSRTKAAWEANYKNEAIYKDLGGNEIENVETESTMTDLR